MHIKNIKVAPYSFMTTRELFANLLEINWEWRQMRKNAQRWTQISYV